MIIYKCSKDDLSVLTDFNKRLIEDEKSDNPMNRQELYQRMSDFISGNYDAYLFQENGESVGYALVDHTAQPLYLRQFYIDRPFRRRHYGEQAFHLLLDHLGTDKIDIEVLTWNEAGLAFWRKLNFKERSIYMRYEK